MDTHFKKPVIAILGTLSGNVPIEVIWNDYKPNTILLWGFDGISKQVYEWAKNRDIALKQYYPRPWNEQTKYNALKEIAINADVILLFHDYHPSSWVDYYNSDKADDPLDQESTILLNIATELEKNVKKWKVEKVYHHQFMIVEEGEKGGHIFDIEIQSKDMCAETATGEAMAKAQMYFINYIYSPLHRKYAGFYHLKRLEGRYWKDVHTHLLEQWFNEIKEEYSK